MYQYITEREQYAPGGLIQKGRKKNSKGSGTLSWASRSSKFTVLKGTASLFHGDPEVRDMQKRMHGGG